MTARQPGMSSVRDRDRKECPATSVMRSTRFQTAGSWKVAMKRRVTRSKSRLSSPESASVGALPVGMMAWWSEIFESSKARLVFSSSPSTSFFAASA